MRLLVLGFVVAFANCHAMANPIAVDSERRHAEMLSETVDISVGADCSRVSGQFRFRQAAPFSKEHTHVTIFVPLFLPSDLSNKDYATRFGSPCIEASGGRYFAEPWNDIALEGAPQGAAKLPNGWSEQLFVCQLPLPALNETFDVRVSYVQPHFPHGVSAYIPVKPPRDEHACSIRFSADAGRLLRRTSFLSAWSRPKPVLEFIPKDRILIQVKVVPAASR